MKKALQRIACLAAAALALSAQAQQPIAQLRGTVHDPNGGVIPGARLTAVCEKGIIKTTVARSDGSYVLDLPVDRQCVVHATSPGFSETRKAEHLPQAGAIEDFTLSVKAATDEIVVHAGAQPLISVDPTANAGAIVLGQHELNSLPDDPEDLMEDLLAMAGPTPPGGVQLYTDGFTARQLPPKSTIREIKINDDPYSAEYHHVGLGRIEVLTKPGSNKVHGQFAYRYGNAFFDSLNPYAVKRAPYWAQLINGSIGGPMTRKISYFANFQDWIEKGNAVIDAQVLDPTLTPTSLRQTLIVPAQNLTTGARFDFQATQNTTLTARFQYTRRSADGRGPGGFYLGPNAYNMVEPEGNLQLSAVSALNRSTLNQLRFQYLRQNIAQTPSSTTPTLVVMDSFTSGGSAAGAFSQHQSLYEIQDYVSRTIGRHTLMIGGQTRFLNFENAAPVDFNGQYVFSGGSAPVLGTNYQPVLDNNGVVQTQRITSLERYRRTLLFQSMNMTPAQIRALGGGASQYTIATGTPTAQVMQFDFGAFAQDDWKVTDTLSVTAGLRWEGQNTIHRWTDLAPRVGFAWMPFGHHSGTVLRAGSGIFFDRFDPGLYLDTLRYNGILQQRYVIANPDFYPTAPPVSTLAKMGLPQTIQTIAPGLRSPYIIQSSAGIEQRLPGKTVAGLSFISTMGRHLLYSANVAANPSTGNNYQYQSGGSLNETQLAVSIRRKYHHGFALFGNYTWTHARDNTDGPSTFPINGNNIAAEYGRAATDIHHYAMLDATTPGLLGTRMIFYLIARSGAPFNITTGHDNNGDSIYNDRPGIATSSTQSGIVNTPYGALDPFPTAGETILPRNFGQGPGYFGLNMRISRAFPLFASRGSGIAPSAWIRPAWFHISHTPKGPHFTVIVTARNLLNHMNRGLPSGNLSSPLFNQSNSLASPTKPLHPTYENNRRIQFEVRFNF
jgi:hypothetical protein